MRRAITGFHRDAEEHWVAELSCGHGQHVRHDPPLSERPWVLSEAGRAGRIGETLDCRRCDARELPADFAPYKETPLFDAESLPAALQARHETRAGVWALIQVAEGRVRYRIHAPFDSEEELAPGTPGVVLPEVPHQLELLGPVALRVEFWRRRPEPGA